jgi:hypothetical protein
MDKGQAQLRALPTDRDSVCAPLVQRISHARMHVCICDMTTKKG